MVQGFGEVPSRQATSASQRSPGAWAWACAPQAAAVRTSKRLKVQPNPQEPGGFLVTLTQSKEGAPPVAVTVPVSRPEFLVRAPGHGLRSACCLTSRERASPCVCVGQRCQLVADPQRAHTHACLAVRAWCMLRCSSTWPPTWCPASWAST